MAEFLREYGPAIAWIVAAVGWGVANHQNNRREERKEVRTEIDGAANCVMEILDQLRAYRKTTAGSSEAVEIETRIKMQFQYLSLRIDRLKDRRKGVLQEPLLKLEDIEEKVNHFFDVATGDDFESAERAPENQNPQILARQAKSALAVDDALHRAFLGAYATSNLREQDRNERVKERGRS